MNLTALSGGGRPVDGRPNQRVPELNAFSWRSALSESCLFGGDDGLHINIEGVGRPPHNFPTSLRLNGGHEQKHPSVGGKCGDSPSEAFLSRMKFT
jgi:hypothetical protein